MRRDLTTRSIILEMRTQTERRVAANPQTKPTDLGCESTENTKRRVPELIPVLGSQPAAEVNHKPDGRLPLLKRAATNFAAW